MLLEAVGDTAAVEAVLQLTHAVVVEGGAIDRVGHGGLGATLRHVFFIADRRPGRDGPDAPGFLSGLAAGCSSLRDRRLHRPRPPSRVRHDNGNAGLREMSNEPPCLGSSSCREAPTDLPDRLFCHSAVQPHCKKYLASSFGRNSFIDSAVPPHERGVSRSSRTRGWMRWTRERQARTIARTNDALTDGEVVWS
jgi:hypothetical protein